MEKQIERALDVLTCGAWWDNIPDDVSDADMNSLYDAIGTVNYVLERLTYCSECKYFKQKAARLATASGTCCRKAVFDFCLEGEVRGTGK